MVGTSKRFLVFAGFLVGAALMQQTIGRAQQTPAFDLSQLQIPPGSALDSPPPTGGIDVWVSLVDPPLGQAAGRNQKRSGAALGQNQQRTYARELDSKQDALMAQIRALGGQEIARVRKAHNAVAVHIDASQLATVASLPGVRAVRPVRNYSVDLSTTVPYIGAAAVQSTGVTGVGVRVAVLDTGIDYTHYNFGGPGTVAAYIAAAGTGLTDPANTIPAGFPTAKVVDGFDFVGEEWPNKPLAPDPDPIDRSGHGTHVADIIAGHSLDNLHKGVAPDADLLAVKVCSTVSTACSGIALLKGLDFALDPNGDDDLSDAVDVINMSLGSDYGQEEDDLAEASANAVNFGVVVVAAAGNGADKPYIVSSPSIGDGVISVAETAVPLARAIPLVVNSPANIAGIYGNTATVDWAPVDRAVTGNVVFVGRGCPAGSIATGSPADPYQADPAGKVALIDRGACAISLKVDRAAKAGATAVLIGLVATGDAISFSFGGGDTFVPTLVIQQSLSNSIKANIAAPVNVTISPANAIALVGSMQSTSARGPSYSHNAIKPDISAPGASISAEVGTGNGQTAFGGTSGATPMVSGSAALLLQANGSRTPTEIKTLLMNTAETNIFINPATQPGVLAPITRIGAGEVRVNRAVRSTTAAWDAETEAGSLSFGYHAAEAASEIGRRLIIRNFGARARTYGITAAFRYANDASSGAVTVNVPGSVRVAAGATKAVKVTLNIDPTKLPTWNLNGGSQGGNGALLQGVEFDGYLTIADGTDTIRVPWHVLPHKAAAVSASATKLKLDDGSGSLTLSNAGATSGRVEVFSLTGKSKKVPKDEFPLPGDNFATIDLKGVGVRTPSSSVLQFGIATNQRRSHPNYPAEFDIYVDTNDDNTFDYVIFNTENGGFGATGQNVVFVAQLPQPGGPTPPPAAAFFFADADLDSSNYIATVPLSALGMTTATTFNFSVYAFDNYFTGELTDAVEGMRYTPSLPRFVASALPATGVPVNGTSELTITAIAGGDAASPSQTGFLLLYRDADAKRESALIDVKSK
jgi:subtilisin family serine protease